MNRTFKKILYEDDSITSNLFSDASLIFSLRKIINDAPSKCIRVRRSSDNSEQDFNYLNGTIDTASILSFVGAGDGFVVTWYNQISNGLDATNAVQAEQPRIVVAGVLQLSVGKPSIYFFNRSNILKTVATPLLTDSGGLWQTNCFCEFQNVLLGNQNPFGADQIGITTLTLFDSIRMALTAGVGNLRTIARNTVPASFTVLGGILANLPYIISTIREATQVSGYINNSSAATTPTTGTPLTATIEAGVGGVNSVNGSKHAGWISEIIHIPAASVSRLLAIRDFMNQYYSVY